MKKAKLSILLFLWLPKAAFAIIGPPVKCYGAVPKITEGEYFQHDENGTYLLRVTTNVALNLDLKQRSCFQVDVKNRDQIPKNGSDKASDKAVESLFYSVRYLAYQQSYDIRHSYKFGIAELQTFCRCDCPTGDEFCNQEYGRKPCSKGEVCITDHRDSITNAGCAVQTGPGNLCCEISASPFEKRKFVAINLVDPSPQAKIEIDIYTLYQNKWSLFRRYQRTVIPHRANNLRLNGFENVAEMYIRVTSESPRFYLKNGDKWYFYEDKPEFKLMDDRRVNGLFERDPNKFGWLRYQHGEWNVGDVNTLATLHDPVVTNCKEQKYSDRFQISAANVVVIRNRTGSINARPYIGVEVTKKQTFIEKVRLTNSNFGLTRDSSLNVEFKSGKAPSLKFEIQLYQKLSVVSHIYASYLEDFVAHICLDKGSFINYVRFWNIIYPSFRPKKEVKPVFVRCARIRR